MAFSDVVSNVRERLRRGIGRGNGREIQLAREAPRLEQLSASSLATPVVDVYENDKELLIHADVPGGYRDGATVAWNAARGLTLLVKTQEPPSGTPWASEYKPGDWYRAFELPAHVDGSKAASTIKDGVLTIRIPKRSNVEKLIPVKAG
jgi:HSP20 family molecular chaperone IbpA